MLTACKDNGPSELGPPANMAIVAGNPTAPANTVLTGLQLAVRDARNNPLPNQTVTFTVVLGGGSIQQTTATTGDDGTLTVPAWLLGKSAVPQKLRATVASVTLEIDAAVQTSYNIVVRFFGDTPTPAQQELFTSAAARIRGVITGELQNVTTGSLNLQEGCEVPVTINEQIDDIVIYATVTPIDGERKILASAGPCYVRNSGPDSLTTIIGVMKFDVADINNLREEVVMHEMLHVVGVGSMWLNNPGWNLVAGAGTTTPRYTGVNGRQGCQEIGGTVTCSTSVPLENDGGPGTADVHWEELDFGTELMTGFSHSPPTPMPFSLLTIRSLIDINYDVNLAAFDPFTKTGLIRANARVIDDDPWEQLRKGPITALDARGRIMRVFK